MKKILFLLVMLLILGIVFSYAQCSKKQVVTASKTEYLDVSGNVERTVDEPTLVEYDKSSITITHGAQNQMMSGTVKSDSCNWKIPYKDGKSVIKAAISNDRGETMNLTITIEGKDGNLSFLAEVVERPDRRIRIVIDKFEEKK